MKTKAAQEAPNDKEDVIREFLQEIRQVSQPGDTNSPSRFPLQYIYNMDQTPMPFEFLKNRTFAPKGSKIVWIKAENTNWTKRQATLMITICADGISHCLPILIFRGQKGRETAARQAERRRYHSDVRVIFNTTAYSNEAIILDWLKHDVYKVPSDSNTIQPERLIILDVFLGQTTDEVKETMAALHVTPIYILEGCTGYVQPLDTDINKMLKDKIGFFLDEILMENELGLTDNSGSQIGNRRVAVTHAVGKAWHWLHEEKRETIVHAFEHTGISLPPDGSKDHKLNI